MEKMKLGLTTMMWKANMMLKKLMISSVLTFLVGCATIPSKVVVNSGEFTLSAKRGYIDCDVPALKKRKTLPFKGNVYFNGPWIVFTPEDSKIRTVVTREFCEVYVMDGEEDGRQEDYETQEGKGLGGGVFSL